MRLLKLVLSALFAIAAMVAGLFVAALVAITGAGLLLARRLLLRPRHRARPRSPAQGRTAGRNAGDVIDVTATEVPLERLPR